MNFNESFYTDDFDQEMMVFIAQAGYHFDHTLWNHRHKYLCYSDHHDEFFACSVKTTAGFNCLTKQQFKEKIGMTTKQFTKADLQDGDICTTVNGYKWYYINNKMHIPVIDADGVTSYGLPAFTDDLDFEPVKSYSVTSVERKGKIIWTKPEDNKVKQEIESIRKQQEELAERLKELEKTIDN